MIDKTRYLIAYPRLPYADSPVFQQQIHDRLISGWAAGEDWSVIAPALDDIRAQWEARLSAPPVAVSAT
jgi:hypothetical protein